VVGTEGGSFGGLQEVSCILASVVFVAGIVWRVAVVVAVLEDLVAKVVVGGWL